MGQKDDKIDLLSDFLTKEMPEYAYIFVTLPHTKDGLATCLTNMQNEMMIEVLEDALFKLKNQGGFLSQDIN